MPIINVAGLESLATGLFRAAGMKAEDAGVVARHLVDANLAGHDSHGVMRVIQYMQEIEAGKILPDSRAKVLDDWENGALLDARGVIGQVACHDAMQLAIGKARTATLAAVTLRDANHSGRLGTYVEMAAAAGMIGIVMANGGGAGQWVAPFGGRERRLSTNPIAIGSPSGKDFPIVLDISTSIVPEGKVRHYLQRGEATPDGWLVDADGLPTNDPGQLYATPAGAILPFGGAAGHKGFGLGFMVDIFAGALSAAGCPRAGDFDSMHGSGLFMLAINIDRFGSPAAFAVQIAEMADYVKSSRPAAGFDRVLVPGEYEHLQRQSRRKNGIDLPDKTWREIFEIAERMNHQQSEIVVPIPALKE